MAKSILREDEQQEFFPKEVLREHSKELFQVEKEVFDGVFSTLSEDITIDQARKRINEWLKKEA